MICPVAKKLNLLPEFGMFHSAIMVGPWLIEWNNSSLCIPRTCISQAALFSCDIDSITSLEGAETQVDKLSEFISHWNANMIYKESSIGRKNKNEANCQDFVLELMKYLGIEVNFKGALGNFLTKLAEKGLCEMTIDFDNSFREVFNVKEASVTFKNHKELDLFVNGLISVFKEKPEENIKKFKLKYPDEFQLLKSFDRAFWMRHYHFKGENEQWAPSSKKDDETGELTCNCPFKDPQETLSFLYKN